jgi:GxxExxY protein
MKDRLNALTDQIIGAAIAVHRALGPGLLESAYETCLELELIERGLSVERQKPLPLSYRQVVVDCAYRMDFVINGEVVVEVKSVERVPHIHEAQILSYLRISGHKLGLLINFNVKWLADEGIHRFVNGFPD